MDNSNEKKDELLTIQGTVERIIYHNDTNGYSVCETSTNTSELITIVGNMPFIAEGETIKAMGNWTFHASFGQQFKVEYFEKQLPATESTILKYLSSRTIKGIGPKTAIKIVDAFGVDTFDVIENHHEWLINIQGITKNKADQISENFKTQFGIRSVMMFCSDFFSPSLAIKVYKRWGGSSVDVIKQNPYLLCDEISGIGFIKADNIASSLGVEKTSIERIMSGIKYILNFNGTQNGHVFLPEDKLIEATVTLLEIDKQTTKTALSNLEANGQIKTCDFYDRKCIYLNVYYDAEKYIASKMDLLDKICPRLNMEDIEKFISMIEREENITYAKLQRDAISDAINNGIMVLTGGPGTGKTTVIRAVMRVFDSMGFDIALAAPTGRAAKRMSEATQREAKTIHRLLEMEFTENSIPHFKRDEKNLLDEEIIMIDEASMIDLSLMAGLLKAIKPGARLVLIGDSDQLPSVGAGNILNDIIESKHFCTVKLTEIFRQAKESLIITNAHAINSGKYPELSTKNNDFFFLPRDNDEDISSTVADLLKNRLPNTYGEEIRGGIQVITPSRKGNAGTEMLNIVLQQALNPPTPKKREKKVRNIIFREGDKVMQIKNNYNIVWEKDDQSGIGVFNGDIGIIESINTTDEIMVINFDERIILYDFVLLDELEHSYAITVHKSQGSEYPIVVLPIYSYSFKLLTRNLLYTAVTRAQKMVVIVGRKDIVCNMVDNNRQTMRYTRLSYILSCYD